MYRPVWSMSHTRTISLSLSLRDLSLTQFQYVVGLQYIIMFPEPNTVSTGRFAEEQNR